MDLFSKNETEELINEWNKQIWLPRIMGTDRQQRLIREALRRPFFRDHWKDSIPILAKSKWLREKMRPRFSIDWYLIPDNFDKIIERKYIDEEKETKHENKSIRRDGGEEFIY